jgi:cell wall assembly regulator SMI1
LSARFTAYISPIEGFGSIMTEEQHVQELWNRLEIWLGQNLPESLKNLRPPATDEDIKTAESITNLKFPEAFKASLKIHDGEYKDFEPGALADSHWLLPLEVILEHWQQYGVEDEEKESLEAWKLSVEKGPCYIKGAVKPVSISTKRIQITWMNGDENCFLDFDPPDGGTIGQVVEIDVEMGFYKVIATSFLAFLEEYISKLESGFYEIDDDKSICTRLENEENPQEWGMPEYLKNVEHEWYHPDMISENPIVSNLSIDQEVIITGERTKDGYGLSSHTEDIFAIKTVAGNRYTFLALRDITQGYGSIGRTDYARVKAVRNKGQIKIDESLIRFFGYSTDTDFIVLDYKMLR